jgi:hypothetical protein
VTGTAINSFRSAAAAIIPLSRSRWRANSCASPASIRRPLKHLVCFLAVGEQSGRVLGDVRLDARHGQLYCVTPRRAGYRYSDISRVRRDRKAN